MPITAVDDTGDAIQSAARLGLAVWDALADIHTEYAEPDREALRKAANAVLYAENRREAPREGIHLAHSVLEWTSGLFPGDDSFNRLTRASRIYEEARIK
jgi:hypothetical protein